MGQHEPDPVSGNEPPESRALDTPHNEPAAWDGAPAYEAPAAAEQPPKRRQMNPVLELGLILVAALGLWYVTNGWIVKPYRIPSGSMEPTLKIGDRVLVNRFIYRLHDPRRGDIIVFHPPESAENSGASPNQEASVYFIKRIVGLPGETVEGRRGHVLICKAPNVGCHALHEPYLTQTASPTDFPPVTIPQGRYFMMGDNREISDDSRTWGTLPRQWIIGEAFATYWPLDHIRTL